MILTRVLFVLFIVLAPVLGAPTIDNPKNAEAAPPIVAVPLDENLAGVDDDGRTTTPYLNAAVIAAAKAAKARRKNKTAAATAPTTTLSPEAAMADPDIAASMQCSLDKCSAPFCQCLIAQPPFGMSLQNTPQMVLMVFHDSVTKDSLEIYRKLFPLTRRNAHGCPQTATVFVDISNSTDFCLIAKLWERGMEIGLTGSTSSAQSRGQQFWQHGTVEELAEVMTEWKQTLHKKSHIPIAEIRGWRTPFNQIGGDRQLQALRVAKFMYDTTLIYRNPIIVNSENSGNSSKKSSISNPFAKAADAQAFLRHQFYPFTFDFNPTVSTKAECTGYPCPMGTHAGLWEVPMTVSVDLEGALCRYVDNCDHQPEDADEMLHMLRSNLYRNYKHGGNRAPVMFSFSNRWHTKDYLVKALEAFLSEMSKTPDIFVVTLTDAIRWMQQPMPLAKIHKLDSWLCKTRSSIKCRSEGAMRINLRSGSAAGVDGGWDKAPVQPIFGRFNRYMWLFVVVTLTVTYIILRWKDNRKEK